MQTRKEYPLKRQGSRVVSDLERFLKSGDAQKISKGLYHELIMHCGFIAHFDIHNFRSNFEGSPEKLLRGETYELQRVPDPKSLYVYTDGLTSQEVVEGIRRIARAYQGC